MHPGFVSLRLLVPSVLLRKEAKADELLLLVPPSGLGGHPLYELLAQAQYSFMVIVAFWPVVYVQSCLSASLTHLKSYRTGSKESRTGCSMTDRGTRPQHRPLTLQREP